VLDRERPRPERGGDPLALAREAPWPRRVVVRDHDLAALAPAEQRRLVDHSVSTVSASE
jgi:hypothetical protein